jgi:hypothetical protein
MALHTPSLRTPVATHHILGWMVGAVALVAVLSIGLVVISRPSAAPSTATAQGVAITQGAAAAQAYQQFRSGQREALSAPQLATQAYLAYRAGERVGPADESQAATTRTSPTGRASGSDPRTRPRPPTKPGSPTGRASVNSDLRNSRAGPRPRGQRPRL